MRDHEAAVESRRGYKEFRQTTLTGNQSVYSSFRDVCEFGHGDRQGIHRDGDRLSVEVAGGDDHVLVREDVRIVRRAVDLVLDHRLDVADAVLDRAVYLRDAAE